MPDKEDVARALADAHREMEPSIVRIHRLVNEAEGEGQEPVKLLEVNAATSPSGILPIAFGPYPPSIPYPSIIIEVTEEEYAEIRRGRLSLPDGWNIGPQLFPAAITDAVR